MDKLDYKKMKGKFYGNKNQNLRKFLLIFMGGSIILISFLSWLILYC